MKGVLISHLLIAAGMVACNNKETDDKRNEKNKSLSEVDGGACSYDRDTLYCRILEIDTVQNPPQVLALAYSTLNGFIDTTYQSFYTMMDDETSIEEMLAKPHYVILEVMQITSGACNPYMVHLLERVMDETKFKRLYPDNELNKMPY